MLHTFRARSLPEALRLVRQELGPEASVLHTREVGGTLARWLGNRTIEVTASVDVAAPSRLPIVPTDDLGSGASGYDPLGDDRHEQRLLGAELADYRGQIRAGLFQAANDEPSLVEQLAAQSSPRSQLAAPDFGPCSLDTAAGITARLRDVGISERTARRWLARLDLELAHHPETSDERVLERLRHIVADELPVRGPIVLGRGAASRPTVVTLVGPTGVGKTTTVAKLAAHFGLRERRRVGLVTGDVFRIAAVEQLRAYAGIMDLPIEVVASPDAAPAALQRLAECDLILFDTAGCSPHDGPRLEEMRALLAAAEPDEVLLVASAVADVDSWQAATETFTTVGASGFILTKLDEERQPGRLAEWLTHSALPLGYTTHGQSVPGDLRPASALGLATVLIAGSATADRCSGALPTVLDS
jgi:flagellar biosynthesis protein FlhF